MDEFSSALDVAARIRAKEVSPSEVLDDCLAKVDARNGAVNAIIWRNDDEARAGAKAMDDRIAAGDTDDLPPFFGVPVPVKDLDHVAGWPTTYGSEGASTDPADADDSCVMALRRGGFLLTGRSNTPEFGTITAAENARYGETRNPWNLDHTPGGSSGGASAAVAAGMFPLGHANDGGGSIRIPASCCGLVGHKPSRGRVANKVTGWEGAAVQGTVTHTVADTAAALDVFSAVDPLAWWNAPTPASPYSTVVGADPGPLRIAVIRESPLGLPVHPSCVDAVDRTVAALESLGHEIVDVTVDFAIEQFMLNFIHVVNAGLALYPVDWEKVEAHNAFAYEQARKVDSLQYTQGVAGLQLWSRQVNAQWGDRFDVLVTPTMPDLPSKVGEMRAEVLGTPTETSAILLGTVSFTSIFNMNGLPATSIPVGVDAATNLPAGVQLVAGPYRDDICLAVAAQVEAALPWRDRRADVSAL